MCFTAEAPWYTRWLGIKPRPLVAKENIQVIKLLDTSNSAIYNDFKYSPNVLYSNEIGKHNLRLSGKFRGYTIFKFYIQVYAMNIFEINVGFHSYDIQRKLCVKEHISKNTPMVKKIAQFIIPKGAKYYYDPHYMEYVSDSIISGDLSPL